MRAVVACSLGVHMFMRPANLRLPRAAMVFRSAATSVAPPRSPHIAGFMRRVEACNNGLELASRAKPFVVPGVGELGVVLPEAAAVLAEFPTVFRVDDCAVELIAGGDSVEARSNAVAEVLRQLRRDGRVPMLAGWRGEGWPVKASFDSPAELVMERAAAPLFGVAGFGCHINGLVTCDGAASAGSRPSHLWVARRAATKQTWPGKLDHVVAGGLAHGERPWDNVLKECDEEASVPRALAERTRPTGMIEYFGRDETGWGTKRDVILCYDLHLPPDFVPVARDGEVESFALWEMRDVIKSLVAESDEWKPNVALVIIDMLVRHGFVAPEEAGYIDLVRSLRR